MPFHRPWFDTAELVEVGAVLESAAIGRGPQTARFERAFADRVEAAEAVAVASGRIGVALALLAVGLARGDEVVTSVCAARTTALAVPRLGARLVPVDVLPDSLEMDVAAVPAAVTAATRAIVSVHPGGLPCDMSAVRAVAAHYDLRLVDEASEALPARSGREMIGSIADVTTFSLDARGHTTTGQGAVLTTNLPDCARFLRHAADDGHGLADLNGCGSPAGHFPGDRVQEAARPAPEGEEAACPRS